MSHDYAQCTLNGETLLVWVLQLLRERLVGSSGGAVGGTSRAARGERAEAVEATGAAVLRKSLGETRGSSVAGGLLLLLRQLLVGASIEESAGRTND
jgi:hypothetical protein